MCKMGFLIHHMITIMGFKNLVVAADHFAWFMMGPMSFHPVMVVFPDNTLFNYTVYMFFFASWIYNLSQPPFWSKRVFRCNLLVGFILLIPLLFIAWGNCMSDFDWSELE